MSYIQDIDTETTRLQFYAVFTGIASRFQVDVLAWNCIRVSSRFTDSKVKWRIPTANFPSGPVLKSARLSSRASDSTSADQRTRLETISIGLLVYLLLVYSGDQSWPRLL